jgi:hypothetical protein
MHNFIIQKIEWLFTVEGLLITTMGLSTVLLFIILGGWIGYAIGFWRGIEAVYDDFNFEFEDKDDKNEN